ncbi:MAG: redoxin domain-containing protein [Bacteroidetes bacterium]|nr:redoxin domain-containing protein [Bacteroidota bacterium]
MKKLSIAFCISLFALISPAQSGYDIKVNFKGGKDTILYLVKYIWDQKYVADTCKNVKNGQARFTGKIELDKGVYVLVSQAMTTYFDFIINETQKFTISADIADFGNTLKFTGSKENELLFSYLKGMNEKNKEFMKLRDLTKGKSKADSLQFMNEKSAEFMKAAKHSDRDFLEKNKGNFVADFVNLKIEKENPNPPKASNGRPDSVYQYYYYKNHFFDGIDFKDERIIRTPFFHERVKRYFESVIIQHPDTMIAEIDKLFAKCKEGNLVYNSMLGYFTYKAETNKNMLFDKNGNALTYEKVFVHLSDNYILNGKAKGVYTEETVKAIKERTDIIRNLLPGATVAELFMIDTIHGKQVMKMGFDTCKSSKTLSDLYYKKETQLKPLYKTLSSVNAKYTVLVFWASDCGHCQTDIPKLKENLDKIKGKIDFKVFAVQTKDEYEPWRKFIIDKKLDFINVFDPMHLNNLKERFDINSTPIIYILDKNKKIKAKKIGHEQVVELLEMFEKMEKEQSK